MIAAAAALLVAVPASAGTVRRKVNEMPAPMLVTPGDIVDLTGKDALEFRWSPEGDRSQMTHYDFRLYKGTQTYEPGLMLKENVPAGQTALFLKKDLFEINQPYSWSVKQVGTRKGATRTSIFKVVKK